jgi:uncharacterized repeat protein (TIGR03803 family)
VGHDLYGVTAFGGGTGCSGGSGPPGCGSIFKITKSGKESVLYGFEGAPDGELPTGALLDVSGTLYGTTVVGGGSTACTGGCGTVFKIATSGTYKSLYSFKGGTDGVAPTTGLIDVGGALYSTTDGGGVNACGCGTIFKITTAGKESVLYSFAGGTDGAGPQAGLTDVNGTLYGTTVTGGDESCEGSSFPGCGTLFKITTAGAYKSAYRFQGGTDGEYPYAGLTDLDGTLYGTSAAGGGSGCGGDGCGTVFSLKL